MNESRTPIRSAITPCLKNGLDFETSSPNGNPGLRIGAFKPWRKELKDDQSFILLPSPELDAFLDENSTDLVEILGNEGVVVEGGRTADPAGTAGLRDKDPVSILVASAGVALALVPALTRILTALTHKEVIVKEMILVPVEDSKGNVVRDAAGNPSLQWVERSRILESAEPSLPKTSVSAEGPVGLKFFYSEK